jgi:hypothetical protein
LKIPPPVTRARPAPTLKGGGAENCYGQKTWKTSKS